MRTCVYEGDESGLDERREETGEERRTESTTPEDHRSNIERDKGVARVRGADIEETTPNVESVMAVVGQEEGVGDALE